MENPYAAIKMPSLGNQIQMPSIPSYNGLQGYADNNVEVAGKSFGDTVWGLLNKANVTMGEAESKSIEAVHTGKVDIHEVMIALGKSEVAFKLITAVTQKVVGAFDKLTSMQV